MADLTELQRLAEGATPGMSGEHWYVLDGHRVSATEPCEPVEHCGYNSVCVALTTGKNEAANAAYIAAMSPDTAKKLIAAVLLADALVNPPQMATGYDQRKRREADEEALRTALEELK